MCYHIFMDSALKNRVILEIKTSRSGEETTEAMVQFLSSLTNLRKRLFLLWKRGLPVTLELGVFNQTIHFYVTCPENLRSFVEGQLTAQYPKSLIVSTKDYAPEVVANKKTLACGQMKLNAGYIYPLKSYSEFKEVDPMSSLLSVLSKVQANDKVVIQFLLNPVGSA